MKYLFVERNVSFMWIPEDEKTWYVRLSQSPACEIVEHSKIVCYFSYDVIKF